MYLSEVAQLRQKIAEEYDAMKQGLSGLACGTAQHTFINTRMQHVHFYHKQLAQYIGNEKAARTVCELYDKAMD